MLEKTPLFAESWNVAWRNKGNGAILHDTSSPFKIIKNSFRYWAADPFVFEHEGKVYIFAELYDFIRRRGTLGYYCLSDGKKAKWKPIIVEKYHLSFPNIFTKDNDIYIMPEANASDELYLYKAECFPDKWKKCCVLRSNVKFADTILFEEGGNQYGLSFDVRNPTAPVFTLLDIDDPQKDYAFNYFDTVLRRPAGKVITDLRIRPAQDCEEDYGKGLVFYQYKIQNGQYSEIELRRLKPTDIRLEKKMYLDGMHTYKGSENYEVVDIKTRRLNLLNLVCRVISKVKR